MGKMKIDLASHVNGSRLWNSLMEMATIGPGIAGGNNRQTLSVADCEGRSLFRRWCEDAGMEVSVDQMGNMFACRPGEDPNADAVCMGSHLDTQPAGGRFDGVLGVLGGLEVVRTLNDLGVRTRRPIVVANWTNEEGSRFAPVMMASGVFAGIRSLEDAYESRDKEGKRFGTELELAGWKGAEQVGVRKFAAYIELHIEQGPILEAEGVDIGVVTAGQGLTWLKVTLSGRSAHAGSTPMSRRRDAGLGAARVVNLVNQVALDRQPNAVGTVGRLEISPNSTNSVAGSADLMIDIRSPDSAVLKAMEEQINQGIRSIAEELGLECEITRVQYAEPVAFNDECLRAIRQANAALGYKSRDVVSGAAHDAYWLSRVTPTAMIMCPCVDGVSHNEAEDISPEWATAGTNVLLHTVCTISGAVD